MIISRDLWMGYLIIRDSWFRQLINRDSVTRGGIYTPLLYAAIFYLSFYFLWLSSFELFPYNCSSATFVIYQRTKYRIKIVSHHYLVTQFLSTGKLTNRQLGYFGTAPRSPNNDYILSIVAYCCMYIFHVFLIMLCNIPSLYFCETLLCCRCIWPCFKD